MGNTTTHETNQKTVHIAAGLECKDEMNALNSSEECVEACAVFWCHFTQSQIPRRSNGRLITVTSRVVSTGIRITAFMLVDPRRQRCDIYSSILHPCLYSQCEITNFLSQSYKSEENCYSPLTIYATFTGLHAWWNGHGSLDSSACSIVSYG